MYPSNAALAHLSLSAGVALAMKTPRKGTDTEKVDVLVFVCPEMLPKVRSALGGVRCHEALELHQAVRVLESRPRLLITKVDRDGFELCRTARQYYPETKVVMLGDEAYGRPGFGS